MNFLKKILICVLIFFSISTTAGTGLHLSTQVVAGIYNASNGSRWLPIMLYSNASGKNWTFSTNISNFPSKGAYIFSMKPFVSCSTKFCVMMTDMYTHFLLISHDKGHSWETLSTENGLPSTKPIISANCTPDYCIATDKINNNVIYSIYAASWKFISNIQNMPQILTGWLKGSAHTSSINGINNLLLKGS